MQEVLEDLASNKLNFDEYPYVQPPTDSGTDGLCFLTAMLSHLVAGAVFPAHRIVSQWHR